MALNISAGQRNGAPSSERRGLADELLDELTAWNPRDRVGTFKRWHAGALSLVHLNVLTLLEARGPMSMSHLAEALDVSIASATGIVTRMERRGFVERRHDAADRRVVLVHPTDRGGGVFREMEAHRRDRLGGLLLELSEDELAGLLAGLRALRAARARLVAAESSAAAAGTDCPADEVPSAEAGR